MKKLVISLFILGFAASLYAEEVKKDLPLTVGVSGIVYSTNYQAIEKNVDGDYTAFRVRPLFNFTDGNIEAVVKLEYDATFGYDAADSSKSSENVGLTADKTRVEVANAYIKTKVDAVTGLTFTGGIAYYDFPLVYGDNSPLVSVNYSNDLVNLGLYYIKPAEGDKNDEKDDSQVYIADLAVKFGDSSIRPAFFAYQCAEAADDGGNGTQYKDSTGYIGALALNLIFGLVGIDASGAYATGEDKVNKVDYSGYAVDVAPYFKLDPIKVTAFFTMVSGDKDTPATDDDQTSFMMATLSGDNSGINNWRLYIIEDGGSFTTNSDVASAGTIKSGKYSNTNGYMAYGLSVDGTFGPITCKLIGAYVQALEVASGADKDMGIEVDANIGYALTKSSTLFVEGAMLQTGKYYENAGGDTQTAQYITVGATYSL